MQPKPKRTIVVRKLPGFESIEAKARIYYNPNSPTPPEFDKAVKDLSIATFGITESDVEDALQKFDEVDDENLPKLALVFFGLSDNVHNSDDDAAEILKQIGVDFSDERGWPLLTTRLFKWQALAALCQIAGKLPDPDEQALDRLAGSLQEEAARFLERKHSR